MNTFLSDRGIFPWRVVFILVESETPSKLNRALGACLWFISVGRERLFHGEMEVLSDLAIGHYAGL